MMVAVAIAHVLAASASPVLGAIEPGFQKTIGHSAVQDDPFAQEEISPGVEIIVAVGNLAFTGYNGWQLAANRRNEFVAGLGIISGAVGIALGLHEASTYPALDLAAGSAAVLSGGYVLLAYRRLGGRPLVLSPLPAALRGRIRFQPGPLRGARLTIDL